MNDFTLDKDEHKRLAERLKSEVAKVAKDYSVWMNVGNEKEGWFNIALKDRDAPYDEKPPLATHVQFQMQREEYDGRKMVKVISDMNTVMAANGLTMFLVCKYAFDKHLKANPPKRAPTPPAEEEENEGATP